MPTISVIVPIYNVEKYIHRCVDSILAQTFTDFELILVDDGSPDNCPAICDEYAAKDSRVRVIHQENQGQAAARNHGVDAARCDWVSFVDSDDLIHPQMLEIMYIAAQNCVAKIVACNAVEAHTVPESFFHPVEYDCCSVEADEDGIRVTRYEWKYCYWVVWGKLIDKQILKKYPMPYGRIYEDNAIVCRWLVEAGKVAYVPQKCYYYQVNPEGTTKQEFTLKKLDLLWALQEQIDFYDSIGYLRMKRHLCAQYLETAAWYSGRVRNELNNYRVAAQIRSDMRRLLRENPMDTLPLEEKQKEAILRAFHPMREQMRQLPKNIVSILNDGGISMLKQRILRKFKRY